MPREVKITAIRHKTKNPKDNDIKFWRVFKFSEKPNFKKFITDYAEDMKRRLYRIAGSGAKLEVLIEEN